MSKFVQLLKNNSFSTKKNCVILTAVKYLKNRLNSWEKDSALHKRRNAKNKNLDFWIS